jgi:hypothetical protein
MGDELPPTGREVSGPGCIRYRFAGGRVVEEWDLWDELGFLQQLGYEVVPPQ